MFEESSSSSSSQAVAETFDVEAMLVRIKIRRSSVSEQSVATFLSLGRCVHIIPSTEEDATAHACSNEGDA